MKQRVLVASNRGPVSYQFGADGSLAGKRGGGGMIAGVISGLAAVAPEALVTWICAALSDADRAVARRQDAGVLDQDGIPVRMLDIPADTFDRAYNSVANSALWFVHHMLFDTPNQPQFGRGFRRDWQSYLAYNEAFADALAEEVLAEKGPGGGTVADVRVLVQDYHLSLAPRLLRERLDRASRDIRVGHFSHTPWAPPDYYRILPGDVGVAVLDGMLGADSVGFHAERWAAAFLDCCRAILGAQVSRAGTGRADTVGRVIHRGRVTDVTVHPLGIDVPALRARAQAGDVRANVAALGQAAGGRQLIVRVDRTELSKNIVRGLAAYRELLATRPEWHGRVIHLAFAYPSRSAVPEYRAYTERVIQMAREITEEFRTPDWNPLILEVQGRLPAVAGRLRGGRRAAREPDQGRHEPGGPGGPGALRAGLRAGAVPRGGRGRDPRPRRAARQPLRRQRDRRGPASGPGHARCRAPPPQRRARRHRRRQPSRPLAGESAGLSGPVSHGPFRLKIFFYRTDGGISPPISAGRGSAELPRTEAALLRPRVRRRSR